jgi:hypothetical protein
MLVHGLQIPTINIFLNYYVSSKLQSYIWIATPRMKHATLQQHKEVFALLCEEWMIIAKNALKYLKSVNLQH